MPWNMERTSHCRVCGKPRKPNEVFSARGKHFDCGDARARANATQLHLAGGPFYERWRAALAAGIGARLTDDRGAERRADAA